MVVPAGLVAEVDLDKAIDPVVVGVDPDKVGSVVSAVAGVGLDKVIDPVAPVAPVGLDMDSPDQVDFDNYFDYFLA